jgi:uncharacterized protein YkwD
MRISWVQAPAAALLAALAVAAPVGATGSTDTLRLNALDASIVAQINVVRRAHRLAPVRASVRLHRSAEGHSRDMGTNGFFAHESRDGTTFWKRIRQDYPAAGYRTWSVGENLAFSSGTLDAAETVRMWMNSPPHRRILLTPNWRDVGISALRVAAAPGDFGGDDVTLVTADFGIRR